MGQAGTSRLKALVDVGGDVQCQAVVPDTSRVFIAIGLGFHLECSHDEAPAVIRVQREALKTKVDAAAAQSASIRANIKLVEEGLRELMGLREPPPRRA
ncbi:hypothetical protein FOA52_007693 [Chlamydomonas sp. UWO 241]|nr:hypothetical protein FOA52_007693 [Chlamydomonas sp. UWO 241]